MFELENSCLGSNPITSEEAMMGLASGAGPAQGPGCASTHSTYDCAVRITLCIICAL